MKNRRLDSRWLGRVDRERRGRGLMEAIIGLMLTLGLFPIITSAQDSAVFGPETFSRAAGMPVTETRRFEVETPLTDCRLLITNGDGPKTRVSSAAIVLNGTRVAAPSDFKQTIAVIEKRVDLQGGNTLAVTLTSRPGAFVVVSIDCPAHNTAPVANAGPDQTVRVGDTVTLDGSASTDLDGDRLTYRWALQSSPDNSSASIADPEEVTPTFNVDQPGDYEVALRVKDGQVESPAALVRISTTNSRPVANAGPDQTAAAGDTVSLDGSASTDVDGQALTFAWTLLAKPQISGATLSDPAAVWPQINLDQPGSYRLRLVVNDGQVDSLPDTVILSTDNLAPTADAGPDSGASVVETVSLDGTGSSDPDGDPLTHLWSLLSTPAGSAAALTDATSPSPDLSVDQPGTYVAQLIVSDGLLDSDPDTALVSTVNTKPVANAGTDLARTVGETVTLDGSASFDADADPLSYRWSFTVHPGGAAPSIFGVDQAVASFSPETAGLYIAHLVVHDGTSAGAPDTAVIGVSGIPNRPPIAQRDGPYSLDEDTQLMVGGPGVLANDTDPDGDPLNAVTVGSASHGTLDLGTSGGFTYTPDPDYNGPDSFTYVANDGQLDSNLATVGLTVTPVDEADLIEVPDLVGQFQQAATGAITAAGLLIGTVTEFNHGIVPAGQVVSQYPGAGGLVPLGSIIALAVSLGPTEATLDAAGGTLTATDADGARLTLTVPPDASLMPFTLRIGAVAPDQSAARFRIETSQNEFRRPIDFRLELPEGEQSLTAPGLRLGPPNDRRLMPTAMEDGGRVFLASAFSLAAEPLPAAPPVAASRGMLSWLVSFAVADEEPASNGLFTEMELAEIECFNELNLLKERLLQIQSFSINWSSTDAALVIAQIKAVELQCSSDPASAASFEAERAFIQLVGCQKYALGMDAVRFEVAPTDLPGLRRVVENVHIGAGLRDSVAAECPSQAGPADYAGELNEYYKEKFIPLFTDRVVNWAQNGDSWPELWGELATIEEIIVDADRLGLSDGAEAVREDLIPPVLESLRRHAYRHCVLNKDQRQLADLLTGGLVYRQAVPPFPAPRVFPGQAPFTDDDLINDIQRCASTLTVEAYDGEESLGTASYAAPIEPGPPPTPGQLEMPPDGTVRVNGAVPAFLCPGVGDNTTIGNDEFVIRLNGVEVARRGHANGVLPATLINLSADALFGPAGIEPADGQIHTLTIHREGPACGATVPGAFGPEQYELYRVELRIIGGVTETQLIAFIRYGLGDTDGIYVMNIDGSEQRRISTRQVRWLRSPTLRWSPDGSRILLVANVGNGNDEIFVVNADGSGEVRLTNTVVTESEPVWSPDGTRIAFMRPSSTGGTNIYVMNSDGTGEQQINDRAQVGNAQWPTWSPDGRQIAFVGQRPICGQDFPNDPFCGAWIYTVGSGGGTAGGLLPTNLFDVSTTYPLWSPVGNPILWLYIDSYPSLYLDENSLGARVTRGEQTVWSPDGTRVAFMGAQDGDVDRPAIFVVTTGGATTRLTESDTEDQRPTWSPDGTRIAFESWRQSGGPRIYVMSADGTNVRQLTNDPTASDQWPSWSP